MATSSATLDRSPRKNWVEEAGGLPPYVRKIARAIHEKRGIPLSQAIPYAIGRLKTWAAGGDNVNADTRAKAAAAIAAWEKLKAKAKITEAPELRIVGDDALGVPTPLLLQWLDDPLVEATPPKRVDLRLKSGRTVNVSVDHARRIHLEGRAASDQRPGAGAGEFDESKHPRGGRGTAAGGKFVAKGATGTEVRAVQRRVGARVDGSFGDKTKAAVEAYQRKHGLTVDGVVGRQTLAALRGRKDAKRVKTGALTAADRSFLAGHVRGRGRRATAIVEAVAAPDFLARVRELHKGELARLPDGGAVKHYSSPDGRDMWCAGSPSTYADSGTDGINWREPQRSPEEAVGDALTRSAAATDPESLGGSTRYGSYTTVTVGGRRARFVGVDPFGRPLVRYDNTSDPVAATWPEIAPAPRIVEARAQQ
jgi:hypothetical protein